MTTPRSQAHTHLMGVGGIGMSALAQLLLARGERVSGCDLYASPLTAKLERLGVAFHLGHDPAHLAGVDRLIVSDAIKSDNAELAGAEMPVLRRSQLLGELMRARRGIAISGTHGKTTTSAMIGFILAHTGRDPTVLLGGELPQFGGNARIGAGEFLVAEACEAYESFLDLEPEVAVITNIEAEHLDHHHTEQRLVQSFGRFLGRVRPGGAAVICRDDPNAAALACGPPTGRGPSGADTAGGGCATWPRVITYALEARADYRAQEVSDHGLGMRFTLVHPGGRAPAHIGVAGLHNVLNALAATAACGAVGVAAAEAVQALASFAGVERRFQVTPTAAGVTVVDDYAHHPTEIRAVIQTARARCAGGLAVVFQPHLYSRTRDFLPGFAAALALADRVIVTDIYPAREAPLPGITGESIVRALHQGGKQEAHFHAQKEQVASSLAPQLQAGDWVLVLGAGDIGAVVNDLVERLGRAGGAAAAPAGAAPRPARSRRRRRTR